MSDRKHHLRAMTMAQLLLHVRACPRGSDHESQAWNEVLKRLDGYTLRYVTGLLGKNGWVLPTHITAADVAAEAECRAWKHFAAFDLTQQLGRQRRGGTLPCATEAFKRWLRAIIRRCLATCFRAQQRQRSALAQGFYRDPEASRTRGAAVRRVGLEVVDWSRPLGGRLVHGALPRPADVLVEARSELQALLAPDERLLLELWHEDRLEDHPDFGGLSRGALQQRVSRLRKKIKTSGTVLPRAA